MIRLQESLRGVFYAPFYAALERGDYVAAGVDVTFVPGPTTGDAAASVMAEQADVAWGGPMRVMHSYNRDPHTDLVCFGEAVTRDPFILVGRTPRPDFALADLTRCRLGSVAEVPTPWLCLQHDLRLAGIDPASLDRVADRGMADNVAALRRGALDVVQLFQPFAEDLISSGDGHVWHEAATRGPCSYTTFYARRGVIAARRTELVALVRGLYRAQTWLAGVDGAALAAVIAPYFPSLPADLLAACCARYQRLGVWGRDPVLPRAGYDRLRDGLVSGGFVAPGAPFELAVDNSLATEVLQQMPETSPPGASPQPAS